MTTWPVRSTPAALPTGSAVWRGRIRCGNAVLLLVNMVLGTGRAAAVFLVLMLPLFFVPLSVKLPAAPYLGQPVGARPPQSRHRGHAVCGGGRCVHGGHLAFIPALAACGRVYAAAAALVLVWAVSSLLCRARYNRGRRPPPLAQRRRCGRGGPRRAIKHKAPRPGLAQDPGGAFAHICCFPSVSAPGPAASHKAPGRFWLTAAPGSRPPWPHSRRGCTLPA